MITVCKYTNTHFRAFKGMLNVCFNKDYGIPLSNQQLEELCAKIIQSVGNGITFLYLILVDGEAKGFIHYQIDTTKSDWCEKENWGCIRELYISDDVRGKGYGKILVAQAENELWKLSTLGIYLTTDDTLDFWIKLGYNDTGGICNKNNGNILSKVKAYSICP